jgi:hypothetical protein
MDRTAFALGLDVLLLTLFLLIQSPRITGVFAHEVIGLAIAAPLVIHLLLSWHWIIAKGKRMRAGSLRARFNYSVNVALFIAMVVAIVTGTVVSRSLLPALGIATIYDADWYEVHDASSNVLLVAIGLHLAMNWGWVLAALRRRPFRPEEVEANAADDDAPAPTAERARG